jgi:hypothetical protein
MSWNAGADTEPDTASREAISTRIREAGLENVAQPIALDVEEPLWPVHERYEAVLCINMIHISPWRATHALFRGAARLLDSQGRLILYGPYLENGTAVQSNLDFDASPGEPEWVCGAGGSNAGAGRQPSAPRSHAANNLTGVHGRRDCGFEPPRFGQATNQ